jgi:hypothetical protein
MYTTLNAGALFCARIPAASWIFVVEEPAAQLAKGEMQNLTIISPLGLCNLFFENC